MVALATAFVRVKADTSGVRGDVEKGFRGVGSRAGQTFGGDFARDAGAKLRNSRGQFTKSLGEAGIAGGKAFGEGFTRDASGRLRDASGKFVTEGVSGGKKTGKAFSKGFGLGVVDLKTVVAVAAAGAVASIAKIGMEYEDNLNIFKSVTQATGAQMDEVADKARQLGADVKLPGVSAAGAAASMTELAKAGFTVEQAMDAAQGTLQLARAAGIDEAQAATIAANAVNAFGIKASEVNFVVDELAATANSSSIEVTDAADSFKMAAAVFSSFQGPVVGSKEAITELNTAVAILGNNGIRGSDAGTSLKQALLQLTGPSEKAKGIMKELALEAQGANISLEDQDKILYGSKKHRDETINSLSENNKAMAAMGDIAYDAAGRMRPLKEIIDLVTRGTKNMTQEDRNYAITQIFGADASRAIIALMKGGLPVYEAQRKAILRSGAAADVAAAKNAGLKGALDNVKSQFENAAISVYNVVKGPLTKSLNDFAARLPGIFAAIGKGFDFIAAHKEVILGVVLALTAMKLALVANSAAAAVMTAGGLIKWLRATTAAQWLLNIAMDANPIGIVVLAIGALVTAFILLYRNNEGFRKAVQAVWSAIKTAIGATVNWITGTAWPAIKAAWNGIAAGAMWLYHNVIQPVWNGIKAVIAGVITGIKFYVSVWTAIFKAVGAVATALWKNIISPAFNGIAFVVKAAVAVVQLVFAIWVAYMRKTLGPIFTWLYNNVIKPVWNGIKLAINNAWVGIKFVFGLIIAYLRGPLSVAWAYIRGVITTAWNLVKGAISAGWNFIKVPLQAMWKFITTTLPSGFRTGVSAITKAWNAVREAARKPVAFVVNSVINPLIGGFNNMAKIFGTTPIDTIKGFASGGRIPGRASRTDNLLATMTDPSGRGIGNLKVATGEYVVNSESTSKWLPVLDWINGQGRRSINGVTPAAEDGLPGYADGGIVGFFKKLGSGLSSLTDPAGTLRRIAGGLLSRIPGGGPFVGILKSMGTKVLNGLINKLKAAFVPGGGFGNWPSSPAAQRGDSGVWRQIVALIKATGPLSGSFGNAYRPGDPLWHGSGRAVDWMGYEQDALATFLANRRPLELIHRTSKRDYAYTRGQNMGSFDEGLMNEHRNHVHIAMKNGGLLGRIGRRPEVRLLDRGGRWPSGTIGVNASGHDETVLTGGPGGDMAAMLELLSAILAALQGLGVDMAAALQSNTLRAATAARGMGTGRH